MKRREFLQSGLLLGAASMGMIPTGELVASEFFTPDVPVTKIDEYDFRVACEFTRYGYFAELKQIIERFPGLIHYHYKEPCTAARGPTLAHAAAAPSYRGAKDTSILEYLLSRGVDPNVRDCRGRTPLHYALILYCRLEVLECLVAHGADVTIPNNNGLTPLHCAAKCGPEIRKYLADQEAIAKAKKSLELDQT